MPSKERCYDEGVAYTWDEFNDFYAGTYKKKEIAAYRKSCKVSKPKCPIRKLMAKYGRELDDEIVDGLALAPFSIVRDALEYEYPDSDNSYFAYLAGYFLELDGSLTLGEVSIKASTTQLSRAACRA